jgi:hypothetical protein
MNAAARSIVAAWNRTDLIFSERWSAEIDRAMVRLLVSRITVLTVPMTVLNSCAAT